MVSTAVAGPSSAKKICAPTGRGRVSNGARGHARTEGSQQVVGARGFRRPVAHARAAGSGARRRKGHGGLPSCRSMVSCVWPPRRHARRAQGSKADGHAPEALTFAFPRFPACLQLRLGLGTFRLLSGHPAHIGTVSESRHLSRHTLSEVQRSLARMQHLGRRAANWRSAHTAFPAPST